MSDFKNTFWHQKALMQISTNVHGATRVYRLSDTALSEIGSRWNAAAAEKMVAHQVLVGNVRSKIEKHFNSAQFVYDAPEGILAHQDNSGLGAVVPDLVAIISGKRVAIEIERSAWRGLGTLNPAYEERFDALSLKYDLILYILGNEEHLKPLMKKANGRAKIGFASILNPEQILRLGHHPTELPNFIFEITSEAA